MIPFISFSTYTLWGLTFQTWGTFVALGFVVGTWLAYRRAQKQGLQAEIILDLAFWIFIAAFIGARFFHVLFYEPQFYWQNPWKILDLRQPGFAMFGGFIGAAGAFFWYVRRQALDWIVYADTLVWGLPWGCGLGRMGCFLIHDHPGTLTNFILGIRYPDGTVRHDLGFYLALIGLATGGLFLVLNRHERRPGFWLATYMLIEGSARFSLDFLRVAEARYLGLTPTQYLALPLALLGLFYIARYKTKRV